MRTSQKSLENNNIKKHETTAETNNCNICERNDFSTETELVAHRKLVHHIRNSSKNGAVSLHCAYCNEICKTRTELENHMKSHSQSSGVSGKHKCNICDELCPSPILLAEHKLTHCKVISGNCCTQCKATISNEEQFYSHLVQHSNNNNGNNTNANSQKVKSQIALPSPCVICRQTLISDIEVRIHSQFHLRNTMQQPRDIPCSICFKMVAVQNLLTSNGNYLCSDCFSLHSGQQQQLNIFRCPECQLYFDNNTALEHHIKTAHHNTYTCIKCEATFDNERDVKIHVTNHLMEEGENNECHLCRRLFSTPIKLQIHLIEHNFAGSSAFTCYLCSAVFTGAQGLLTHMVAEHGLGARPYDCSQCKSKFFFRSEVDNHSYTHINGAARLTEADIALMSPKAYYISSIGKYEAVKNGDASNPKPDAVKRKKKPAKTSKDFNDKENTLPETETDLTGIEENITVVTVKEEPDYDEANKNSEYIEVVSPSPNVKTELHDDDAGENIKSEN